MQHADEMWICQDMLTEKIVLIMNTTRKNDHENSDIILRLPQGFRIRHGNEWREWHALKGSSIRKHRAIRFKLKLMNPPKCAGLGVLRVSRQTTSVGAWTLWRNSLDEPEAPQKRRTKERERPQHSTRAPSHP